MLLDLQLDLEAILTVYFLWEFLSFDPSLINKWQEYLGLLQFVMPISLRNVSLTHCAFLIIFLIEGIRWGDNVKRNQPCYLFFFSTRLRALFL